MLTRWRGWETSPETCHICHSLSPSDATQIRVNIGSCFGLLFLQHQVMAWLEPMLNPIQSRAISIKIKELFRKNIENRNIYMLHEVGIFCRTGNSVHIIWKVPNVCISCIAASLFLILFIFLYLSRVFLIVIFFYHASVSLFGCKISLSKCNITGAHKPNQVSCSLCSYFCFHLNDPYLCFFVLFPVSHLGWPRSISMI